ncbi:MAG: hypothetical protein WCT37_00665 [Patescibacteria group bacterium]|jgi:hypothetical protein
MPNNHHIVIFSHGFGVKKDDRGLLSDIAGALENTESRLFDYNEIDEVNNIITASPLSEQVKILQRVIEGAKQLNPGVIIDIICHSQGALAAALLAPIGIRKVIFLAPPLKIDIDHTIAMFNGRPGTVINFNGVSRLARRDGSLTLVPPEHWQELRKINPIDLYNNLAEKTELIIINAKQDEVLASGSSAALSDKIEVISLDGDHGFKGASREPLLEMLEKFITTRN